MIRLYDLRILRYSLTGFVVGQSDFDSAFRLAHNTLSVAIYFFPLSYMAFKSIQRLPEHYIHRYLKQLEQHKRGLERIRHALPASLASHVLYCVIDEKKIVLYTGSAAWASQLRFYRDEILSTLTTNQQSPTKLLNIRILPQTASLILEEDLAATLPSADNIALLKNQSNQIADDELKLALQKLSATLSRRLGRSGNHN